MTTHLCFGSLNLSFLCRRYLYSRRLIKLLIHGVYRHDWLVFVGVKSDPVLKFVLFRPWRYYVGYHTLVLILSFHKSFSNSMHQHKVSDWSEFLGIFTIPELSALCGPAHYVEKASCQYRCATQSKCYHCLPIAHDPPFCSRRFDLECFFVILSRRRYQITRQGTWFVIWVASTIFSPTGYRVPVEVSSTSTFQLWHVSVLILK